MIWELFSLSLSFDPVEAIYRSNITFPLLFVLLPLGAADPISKATGSASEFYFRSWLSYSCYFCPVMTYCTTVVSYWEPAWPNCLVSYSSELIIALLFVYCSEKTNCSFDYWSDPSCFDWALPTDLYGLGDCMAWICSCAEDCCLDLRCLLEAELPGGACAKPIWRLELFLSMVELLFSFVL